MKQRIITEIICSLLILLFTYAAVTKLTDREIFQSQLIKFPVLNSYATLFSWVIPIGELSTVLLLLVPEFKLYGLYASALLLSMFTIFLILVLTFDKHLPCSCGGVIAKLSWKQHVVFNLFFIMISLAGIFMKKIEHQMLHQQRKTTQL